MASVRDGSPKNALSGKSGNSNIYRSYLCTEPFGRPPLDAEFGSVNLGRLLETLQMSAEYFSKQNRLRTVERLRLEMARLNMGDGEWKAALQILLPVWKQLSWRREGWWDLVVEVGRALKTCAHEVGDVETLIAVEWELLCGFLPSQAVSGHDFMNVIEDVKSPEPKPKASVSSNNVLSCIAAKFGFSKSQGHVGIALPFQVVIYSVAHNDSAPVLLSRICLRFEGGLRDIVLIHDSEVKPQATAAGTNSQLYEPLLHKGGDESLAGASELTFSPGQKKVFLLEALPLDAGFVTLSHVMLCVTTDRFDFDISISNPDQLRQEQLWVNNARGLSKVPLASDGAIAINILPKPPKIRIELPNLVKAYFTNEHVALDLQVVNDEEEVSDVNLEVKLLGSEEEIPSALRWATADDESADAPSQDIELSFPKLLSLSSPLGHIKPGESQKKTLLFRASPQTADISMEIQARYHLISDAETPISRTLLADMHFMRPFEANFDFKPQIQPQAWPSYFQINDSNADPTPTGLIQNWAMTASIASFASTPLLIESTELQLLTLHENTLCQISAQEPASEPTLLPPTSMHETHFTLHLQKPTLDDRRTTYADFQLLITWRRNTPTPGSPINTTLLPIPELVIPFGEPRVLASARTIPSKHQEQQQPPIIELSYTIENPSMHVLAFSIGMDASEEFAFSGPKATAVQLVPLSRHTVRYLLLPLKGAKWIAPQAKIVDVHWNKILKPLATEGLRSDRRGVLIWGGEGEGKGEGG